MINKYQAIYSGNDLLAPSGGVLAVYALGSGTIKNIRAKVRAANMAGNTVFNLSKNGADLFTTELTITSGQTSISLTGLSITVVFGDLLVLKLTTIATGGVTAPVALQFESEELLILSAADLSQLQTDLNLSGTNTGDETTSTIKSKLGISTLSGSNTGDESASSIGSLINGATSKATPIDADYLGLMDSAASNILKKLSWANVKATLKTYFDALYQAILVSGTNIKTINGSSLLGSGDLTVSGGGGSVNLSSFGLTEKADIFSDAFASLDTATKWTASSSGGGSAPAVTSGVLNLQPNTGSSGNSTLVSQTAKNMIDTELIVEVPQVQTISGLQTVQQLLIAPSPTSLSNYVLIGYSATTNQISGNLSGTSFGTTPTYNSTNHRWWKITCKGNSTIIVWVSPNGATWTELGRKATNIDMSSVYIWLRCANFATTSGSPNAFQLDNLVLRPLMTPRWQKETNAWDWA